MYISLVVHTLEDEQEPLDSMPGTNCTTQNFKTAWMKNLAEITRLALAIISFVLITIPTACSLSCWFYQALYTSLLSIESFMILY